MSAHRKYSVSALRWGTLALSLISSPLLAQTAGQLAPPTFRPPLPADQPGLVIPETAPLPAPPVEENSGARVHLRKVSVEDGLAPMAEATEAITARLTGQTVTAGQIFAAAREIESLYAQAGYVLARVVVPAQRLEGDADLRLVVIDGFIERVDTTGVPEKLRTRIDALLARLVGQRGLRMPEIERQLLLAGETPGAILRSTLAAGTAPGSSVLIIEAQHRAVVGSLTVDNSLTSQLGRWTTGVGLDLNSVAGLGELVYLRASGYPKGGDQGFFSGDPRNRALAAGLVLPLGTDGLTLNLEAAEVRATPSAPSQVLGFGSLFRRFSANLRYPVIRERAATLNAKLGFDAAEQRLFTVRPVGLPLSYDRLRVLRAGGDGTWRAPWDALVSGQLTASQGLNALGARSEADADPLLPLSRQGSDANFKKLELGLGYAQALLPHLNLNLQGRAQTSFNHALSSAEQIGLAGATGLSAFDAGTFQGDSGYVLRAELASPWRWAVAPGTMSNAPYTVVAAPYVFASMGAVRLAQPTFLESRDVHSSAYGVGVRLAGAPTSSLSNANLTLEFGRQHRDDDVPTGSRFNLIASFQF